MKQRSHICNDPCEGRLLPRGRTSYAVWIPMHTNTSGRRIDTDRKHKIRVYLHMHRQRHETQNLHLCTYAHYGPVPLRKSSSKHQKYNSRLQSQRNNQPTIHMQVSTMDASHPRMLVLSQSGLDFNPGQSGLQSTLCLVFLRAAMEEMHG